MVLARQDHRGGTASHDSTSYEDHRLRVIDWYNSKNKVVYHVPIVGKSQAHDYEPLMDALATLLQAERLPDKPLAHFDFLGPERATMRIARSAIGEGFRGGSTTGSTTA